MTRNTFVHLERLSADGHYVGSLNITGKASADGKPHEVPVVFDVDYALDEEGNYVFTTHSTAEANAFVGGGYLLHNAKALAKSKYAKVHVLTDEEKADGKVKRSVNTIAKHLAKVSEASGLSPEGVLALMFPGLAIDEAKSNLWEARDEAHERMLEAKERKEKGEEGASEAYEEALKAFEEANEETLKLEENEEEPADIEDDVDDINLEGESDSLDEDE